MHFKCHFVLAFILFVVDIVISDDELAQRNSVQYSNPFSHLAHVTDQGTFFLCFGTIVSEYYVITSAHCVSRQREIHQKNIRVYLGQVKIPKGAKHYRVKNIKVHPRYWYEEDESSDKWPVYDLAVLELSSMIPLSKNVKPISIASRHDSIFLNTMIDSQTMCTTFSWSSQKDPSNVSIKMRPVYLADEDRCSRFYKGRDKKKQFCGIISKSSHSCRKEIGSPIICKEKVYGLHLWTKDCGLDADMFSRLDLLYNFIDDIVGLQGPPQSVKISDHSYSNEDNDEFSSMKLKKETSSFIEQSNIITISKPCDRNNEPKILGSGIFISPTLIMTSVKVIIENGLNARLLQVIKDTSESAINKDAQSNTFLVSKFHLLPGNKDLILLEIMNDTILPNKPNKLPYSYDDLLDDLPKCFTLVLQSKLGESLNFNDPYLLYKSILRKIPIKIIDSEKCSDNPKQSVVCGRYKTKKPFCIRQGTPVICGNTIFAIKKKDECNIVSSNFVKIINVKSVSDIIINVDLERERNTLTITPVTTEVSTSTQGPILFHFYDSLNRLLFK